MLPLLAVITTGGSADSPEGENVDAGG